MTLPSWYEYPETEESQQIKDYYYRLKENLEKNKGAGFAAHGLRGVESLGDGRYRLAFWDGTQTEVRLQEQEAVKQARGERNED